MTKETADRTADLAAEVKLRREALQRREAVLGRHHRELSNDLYRLAELEYELADHHAARSLLLRAVAIERACVDRDAPVLVKSLMLLATVEAALGDFAVAVTHCEEAVQIETAHYGDRHDGLVGHLDELAAIYQWAGRPGDALAAAERAVSIGEAVFRADDGRLVEPLCHLSKAALGCGRYRAAFLAAERARAISKDAAAPSQAHAAAMLGYVFLNIGEMYRARELFAQALDWVRPLEGYPRQTAQLLVNLARVDASLGDYDSARRRLEEGLALLRDKVKGGPVGVVLQNLAIVSGMLGDRTRAFALHQEALQIERTRAGLLSEDVGLNLIAIGKLRCNESEDAEGIASLVEGMVILLNGDDPTYLAEGLRTFAQIFGRHQSAVWVFFEKLAVNLLQSIRGGIAAFDIGLERAFLRSHDDAYRALADRLIADGRLPEAQQVIRMLKEQELFLFTRGGAAQDGRTLASLTPVEDYWHRRMMTIGRNIKASCAASARGHELAPRKSDAMWAQGIIKSATGELSECLKSLAADFAQIENGASARSAPGDHPAAEATKARPEAGIALVQYLVKSHDLRIVVTTADSQRDHYVPLAEGELNRLIFVLRSALQERSETFMPAARRLYDILVAPVLADLRGAEVLALSLDGVLRYLPMATLHDGARYLIESFALVVTTEAVEPSAAPTGPTRLRGEGLGCSCAVGGQAALPGVREELEAIIRTGNTGGGIVPGVICLDENFTAPALRDALGAGNTVVHIASHFVFAVAQETASYLQLGDGSRLTLSDFVEMRVDEIDLVVLSACDTALVSGYHQAGREFESFGALVRSRGARNVVATLWPAVDTTTAELMRAFYRNRYEQGLALPESLRRAQLSVLYGEIADAPSLSRGIVDPDDPTVGLSRVSVRHPFYWASYVLMGDVLAIG